MPVELTCDACHGRFQVPDHAAGKRIKCPKCKAVVRVPDAASAPGLAPAPRKPAPRAASRKPAAPAAGPAEAVPAAPRDAWYLKTEDGEDYGPLPKRELDDWLQEGRITAECQLLQDGTEQWQWAAAVYPQLAAAKTPPTEPPSEPAVAPTESLPEEKPAVGPAPPPSEKPAGPSEAPKPAAPAPFVIKTAPSGPKVSPGGGSGAGTGFPVIATRKATGDVVDTPVLACGLIGSALLIAGVFMPVIQAPFVGSANYFTVAKVEAGIVLGVGVMSAVATLLKVTWPIVVSGLASLGLLTHQFTNFTLAMAEARASLKDHLRDNPFAGLADAFTEAMGIQWGFAVLVLGSLALIVAPMLREFGKPKDRTNTIVSGLVLTLAVIVGVAGITYLTRGKGRTELAEGDPDSAGKSTRSVPSLFAASRPSEDKKDESPNPITIGETIQLGNLKITPKTAVKRPITEWTSMLRDETKTLDGPFIVITAEVENVSEGQVFNPFAYATGVDNYGNEFKPYDSTFICEPEIWYGDLNPGERATVTLVLKPKNSNARWYRITVSQWVDNKKSSEEWSILLNNE